MSPDAAVLEAAREPLLRARRLLCEPTPGNIDLCRAELSSAMESAGKFLAALTAAPVRDRAILGCVVLVQNELRAVSALLDRAAAYHVDLLTGMLAAAGQDPEPARPHTGCLPLQV